MIGDRFLAAGAALAFAMPAGAARPVDYSLDEAGFATWATDLKIHPVAPLPARGGWDIALTVAPDVDHKVLGLGQMCGAWKLENPMGGYARRMIAGWDRDGALAPISTGPRTIALTIQSARSYTRCVQIGELNVRCITKVAVAGSAVITDRGTTRTEAVAGEAERDASVGGFCENMTRGVAVTTREAMIAFIADLARRADAPRG